MKVEILATNPRLAEWDKSFRGKNIVTLQKILHSSFGEETYLHPSAVFLYANDEFSLFQVIKDRPRQLSEIDKEIKSVITNANEPVDIDISFYKNLVSVCFLSDQEKEFYFYYRRIEFSTVGDSVICVIKDGNGPSF